MDRDALRKLSNNDLFDHGREAARRKDRELYLLCLELFERRKSALAQDLSDQLAEMWPGDVPNMGAHGWPGSSLPLGTRELADLRVITDREVVAARRAAIAAARKSVWLSTYQYADEGSLTSLLCQLATSRPRIEIRVFASKGRVEKSPRAREQLQQIERAGGVGAVWYQNSTHSKCLVVDDELVMVGSSNLDTSYRDLVLQFRNADVAQAVKGYLMSLVSSDRD